MPHATAAKKRSAAKKDLRHPAKRVSAPWNTYPYPALSVADIADQSYCEKRVHLWVKDPGRRISVPRQIEDLSESALAQEALVSLGEEIHDALAVPAVSLTREDLIEKIASGESLWALETGWSAEFAGFPVAGVPDAVYFDNGRPRIVIDYKNVNSNQLQFSHRVQLHLYGYLLEEAGYDVDGLLLACLLIPRTDDVEILDGPPVALRDHVRDQATAISLRRPSQRNWRVDNVDVGSGTHATLRAFKYERTKAERELAFATDFWGGTRKPWPTSKAAKCACCLYNQLRKCSDALVRYQPGPA